MYCFGMSFRDIDLKDDSSISEQRRQFNVTIGNFNFRKVEL